MAKIIITTDSGVVIDSLYDEDGDIGEKKPMNSARIMEQIWAAVKYARKEESKDE